MSESTIELTESELENVVANAVREALAEEGGSDEPKQTVTGDAGSVTIESVSEDEHYVNYDGTMHGKGGSTGVDAEPYTSLGWAQRKAEKLASEGAPATEEAATEDVEERSDLDALEGVDVPDWCHPIVSESGGTRKVMFLVEDNDGRFHGKSGTGPCESPDDSDLKPYYSFRGSTYNKHASMDDPGRDNPIDDAVGTYE